MLLALALSSALVAAGADPEVDRLRGYMAVAHGHGGVMYRLAQALARAGQADEAVRWVKSALDQGLDLDLGDAAFAALRDREDWKEQLARAEAGKPVATSRVAFRIPDPELIPEGIAWDAKTGDFFVGSLHKKKIVRVGRDGRARDFAAAGQDGLEDVLGLNVDADRRTLWACTAASGRAGSRAGRSGLLAYDLDSGQGAQRRLAGQRRRPAPAERPGRHRRGRSLRDGQRRRHALEAGRGRPGPGGVRGARARSSIRTASPSPPTGRGCMSPTSSTACRPWTWPRRRSQPLPHPDGVSPYGIDGLCRDGADLVAVQNGAGRERIVRYRLDAKGERIERLEVLESRNPLFRTPTTGVVEGDAFVYLANPNLEALDEDGNLKKGAHLEEVVVLRAPLR